MFIIGRLLVMKKVRAVNLVVVLKLLFNNNINNNNHFNTDIATINNKLYF